MSDDDPKPPGGQDYDRMSLDSLKQELEARRMSRLDARSDHLEQIREDAAKPRTSMKKTVGVLVVVAAGIMIALFFASASLPQSSPWSLPAFMAPSQDAGPGPEPEAEPDAGAPDAGPAKRRVRRGMRGGMMTEDDGTMMTKLEDEPFDPIGGIELDGF